MGFLSELFTLGLVLGGIVGSLVMMFSPQRAKAIFKRIGIAYLGWQAILFGLCVLERKRGGITWTWGNSRISVFLLVLVALAASCAAYVIYKIKWGTPRKPLEQRGAERSPQLPNQQR